MFRFLLILAVVMTASGCARLHAPKSVNYRTVENQSNGDIDTARRKHQRALKLMSKCHYDAAEQRLHDALIADVSFGPAHNTLGKLYFDQRKFYLAAWEFEHAIKTMPARAEPVNNLGLVFESVGQVDKAITYYEQAVQMVPDNAQYLGNLCRARIRRGDRSSDLRPRLEELIFLDQRKEWSRWARDQLVLGKIDEPFVITTFGDDPQFGYDQPYEPIEIIQPIEKKTTPGDGNSVLESPEAAPLEGPELLDANPKTAPQKKIELLEPNSVEPSSEAAPLVSPELLKNQKTTPSGSPELLEPKL